MEKNKKPCFSLERPILRHCRMAAVLLSGMAASQAVLAVCFALATRNVINAALGSGAHLRIWAAALVGVAAALPLLRLVMGHYAGRTADRVTGELRLSVLRLLQHKDCESVNAYHSGYLFSRMTGDCRTVCEKYTSLYPTITGQLMQLFSAFAALLLLHRGLALLILLCGAMIGAVGLLFRRALKARHMQVRRAEEKMTSCLQENLEHFELGRSILSDDEVGRRFDRLQIGWLSVRNRLRNLSLGGSALFQLVMQLGSAALILWGAAAIRGGGMSYGDLTAMMQLIALFRSPVTGLTGIQSKMASVDAAQERLSQLCEIKDEPMLEAVPDGAVCRAVVFDRVTFTYAGEERPVFENFSTRIEFGKWTSLTGASGYGKSTLFRLLLGLYYPESGRIYIETDRGDYPVSAATRGLFGFVPQSPVLFSGSVRDNLLLACPDADETKIARALELAVCDFLRDMPNGLDTDLGESGEGLSVGQRQRIAIARALLRDTKLLLLDEVTSALDQQTEKVMLGRLRAAYPTALIATHRVGALEGIDVQDLSVFR